MAVLNNPSVHAGLHLLELIERNVKAGQYEQASHRYGEPDQEPAPVTRIEPEPAKTTHFRTQAPAEAKKSYANLMADLDAVLEQLRSM